MIAADIIMPRDVEFYIVAGVALAMFVVAFICAWTALNQSRTIHDLNAEKDALTILNLNLTASNTRLSEVNAQMRGARPVHARPPWLGPRHGPQMRLGEPHTVELEAQTADHHLIFGAREKP
jgi:hypothetical protein